MPKRVYQWVLYALLLALVAGCGGTTNPGADNDGGSNGGNGNGGGDENNGGQPVTTLKLTAETTSLPSAADDPNTELELGVELMAVLASEDGASSTVPENGVAFAVTGGESGTGVMLYDPNPNDNKAVLFTGGDPTERTITVSARANGLSDIVKVNVTGTTLKLAGPSQLLPSETASYTATLTNSADEGIAGKPVQIVLSGPLTNLSQSVGQTNSDGEISFSLDAENNEGNGDINVTALNDTETAILGVTVSQTSFQFTVPATEDRGALAVDTPATLTVAFKQKVAGSSVPQPVVNREVTFKTTRGEFATGNTSATATTDANGEATVTLESAFSGTATVTAQAAPPSSGTGPAEGPAATMDLEFIATVADEMTLTASPSSIGKGGDSTLIAMVEDVHGNPVVDEDVSFSVQGSGGDLSRSPATTNQEGVAKTVFTAGNSPSYTIKARVEPDSGAATIEKSVTIEVTGVAIVVTLGTDGIAHKPQDENDTGNTDNTGGSDESGDTDGTDGSDDSGGTGDTGDGGDNDNSGNSDPTYKVNYVVVVTDTQGNPITLDSDPAVTIGLLAYQEGTKQYNDSAWAPLYTAPQNTARFGCAPTDSSPQGARVSAVTQTGSGTWAFDITYPQDFSGWAKLEITAEASRDDGTVNDKDVATLLLPMAESDITADASDSPPGIASPYGTDGDCTTLQ